MTDGERKELVYITHLSNIFYLDDVIKDGVANVPGDVPFIT